MTTLLLARHGQTDWNLDHRWQGDPPLNDTGRAQARSLAPSIDATRLDALYGSDLLRARETAEILAELLGLPVRLDARLREIDVGEWAGHTSSEVERRYPAAYRRYLQGGAGWEEGESYDAMVERITGALHALAAEHPGGRLLLVSHAGAQCAAWIACGGLLVDWPGTRNGDVHEVAVRNGELRWTGLVHSAHDRDLSKATTFWRI